MSTRRYSFLCWKVVVILVLEIGILLSVLALYSCKFYNVTIHNQDQVFTQTIGLVRFSLASSSKAAQRQCMRYSNVPLNFDTLLGRWLQNVTAMLAAPQVLSAFAPTLAALSCCFIALQAFKPRRSRSQTSTSAMLFLAGLFRALSIISFDRQSTW
jgi:hypothetical protein